MFFILSKVLYFIIQPLNWILFPLLYSLFGKNKIWKKRTLIFSICTAFFFSNHSIFNQCTKWWETETILTDDIIAPYDIGILLGGYSNFFKIPNTDRHNYNERGARLFQTFELYKKGKFKKFLLSGGSGFLYGTNKSEAILTQELLIQLGVPAEDIIIEPDSKNTYENAIFTKAILEKQYPDARCLLITAAWHMPRSMACFDKANIAYTPFSVDHMSEEVRLVPASLIIPNVETLWRWEILIKEMVGMVAYKARGYI